MQSGNLKRLKQALTKKITLKWLYFKMLSGVFEFKTTTNLLNFNIFDLKINDLSVISKEMLKIKELSPTFVLLRQKKIDYQVNINDKPELYKIALPNIQYMQPLRSMVKWKNPDIGISTTYRNYPLQLSALLKSFSQEELSLETKRKVNAIDNDKIELERRLRVTEEIIAISPYLKKIPQKRLYGLSIAKRPLYKSYFSEEEMESFREILAKQSKTRVRNVEIAQIYDKLNIDVYSSIRQDPSSRELICSPKFNPFQKNSNKMYYLIIGNRRDNKVTIKALVPMETKKADNDNS